MAPGTGVGAVAAGTLLAGLALAIGSATAAPATAPGGVQEAPAPVSFADDVMPILEDRCVRCHGAPDEDGVMTVELGLNLTTYEGIMAGSEYGLVVQPGDPDGSILVDMIATGDMPQEGDPVPPEELEIIRAWIAEGAPHN